jgi:hypothetical protein
MSEAEPSFNMNPTHSLAVMILLAGLFLWLAFWFAP